jgi:hypothetical protein
VILAACTGNRLCRNDVDRRDVDWRTREKTPEVSNRLTPAMMPHLTRRTRKPATHITGRLRGRANCHVLAGDAGVFYRRTEKEHFVSRFAECSLVQKHNLPFRVIACCFPARKLLCYKFYEVFVRKNSGRVRPEIFKNRHWILLDDLVPAG